MRKQVRNNLSYFDGNAARAVNAALPQTVPERRRDEFWEVKPTSAQAKKNRARARNMTYPYMIMLVLAIGAFAVMFTHYLSLHSRIQQDKYDIMKLESRLNDLRMSNDEEYARIMGGVDLENIKTIAMNELGMSYPAGDQIVDFKNNDNDYVRQHADIPKEVK